jgi:phage shock protein PspC (stress-responsive transcriptional regulator)
VLSVFGGTGILLYLAGWLVIPDEVEGTSIVENMISKRPPS